jgi:hypothetical protein
MTMEFAGITINSSINLTDAFPLAAGRETVCPPDEANAASGGDHRNKNCHSNVFFTWLRIIIFERQTQQIVIFSRFRSHIEHFAMLFFSGAFWPKAHWGIWR